MIAIRRPISLSTICWLLIAGGGSALIYVPFAGNNLLVKQTLAAFGVSNVLNVVLNVVTGVISLASGIAMLQRRPWGRQLYLISTPIILVASLFLYQFKLLPFFGFGLILYAIYFFLLTRRAVSDYFLARDDVQTLQSDDRSIVLASRSQRAKKILSVLLLIPGGFLLFTWFMFIVPLSDNMIGLLALSGIFGILAAAFILPAIFLWGRRQWALVLGILLIAVAAMLVFVFLILLLASSMPEFRDQLAKTDPSTMHAMILGSLVLGIAGMSVGVLLILLHRQNEKSPIPDIVVP